MSISKPLASDFTDYWQSAERFLEYFLGSNNLRNEAGELDFEGYCVETVTTGYSRPKYEIYAQPRPQPQPQEGA